MFKVIVIGFIFLQTLKVESAPPPNQEECNLPPNLIEEIAGYQLVASQIIDLVMNGEFKGKTFTDLAEFVDFYPNRLTGGEGLEESIDYIINKMRADGAANVRSETVLATKWTRGKEKAELLEPVYKDMRILGLSPTPSTPPDGITAQVIVVHNFDELDDVGDEVMGKIIAFNSGWLGSYSESVTYRVNGAARAAEYGAVAVLIESVAPLSLDTPHTGSTEYNGTIIPAASLTKEDAEMLSRMQGRGQNITVRLTLEDNLSEEKAVTRNSFGEITGSENPLEIVGISAHIDAWDVGQGAQDDGGGVMITAEALAILNHLGLKPRRTIQAIFWTAEEQGLEGVQQFVNEHRSEMVNYTAIFESDHGTFKARGLEFAGTEEAGCIVQEVLKLLRGINATNFASYDVVGSDIVYMIQEGVPGIALMNEESDDVKLFWYHHDGADMMTAVDSDEMDLCTAVWTVTAYVLADLSVPLPRAE